MDLPVPESCILCLEERSPTQQQYMDVYSAKSAELNVLQIINKHLPIQLAADSEEMRKMCSICWKTISAFHTLYDFVSATQNSLRETKVLMMEDDPLTQSNVNESAKQSADQTELNGRNFFYPEVKIEEHELEQLPKIEVLESSTSLQTIDLDPSPVRRLRKRVKAEAEPLNSSTELGEINNGEAIAATADETEPPIAPKKRRGRPRKTELPKEIPEAEIKVDKPAELEPDMKMEQQADFSDDDQDFTCNFDDELAAHSNGSSDETSESDDDDSDFEMDRPTELTFAVIPKRTPVRPKKYKKRAKPSEPKVRMSRELLDQRKKQQEEYDSIIAKFFSVLPCSICNLVVHNFTEMQRHHRLTHQVDPGYMICCGRKFTQRKVLAEHVLVHWNPEHFKCITCEKAFQNSRHLESHQQVHVAKVSFQCDLCSKVFLSKTAIDYHKLNKHVPKSEFKFTCAECGKKFLTERKLKNHMSSMHDPESIIICDKCGKQMRTKIILKKHQELMHSNTPRPEPELKQCQVCGAWLKGMTGLKQHMKSIHVESAGEHRCHVCSKISPNARALRRHIYHNHECERKFKCTMCDKAFKRPQELKEHTSTHTGEVLYTCPNCPMTFFCSANMYKHRQRLHRAQYEADKNQPKPPNILQQAVGATAAMKIKLMQNSSAASIESDMKHF
ncbi:zinc finger and SCAN domain-containing protein 12 [Drosophila sulfurigaster albostrigata]|uniref:zinc finger and SCAN domain-containing protein 12 n=1 Tax=Drosophila sulfurigaster albostrigata TaxID=89887 RepID=UPI002D21CF3F|nr:zinc finger and SCAN domain-containing protein 12 [Drosophila sulfurigaster albostrigata]